MRTYKHVLFTTLLALVAFTAILYTACSKSSSDKCTGVVCLNGGSCAGGTCSCPTGFTGSRCETSTCDTLVCVNGGTCVNGICSCPSGTEGVHCEILSESKFLKVWNAQDSSASGNFSYSSIISVSTGSNTIVSISSFANQFFTNPVIATIDHNTITIANQSPDNDVYRIQGTGTYANGKIRWVYAISNQSGTTINITGTWL